MCVPGYISTPPDKKSQKKCRGQVHVFGTFPTLFLESGPLLHPHHNGDVASNVLTFEFLDLFAIKLTLLVDR